MDDAENSGVGADAQGQRDDGRSGETFVFPEELDTELEILQEFFHATPPLVGSRLGEGSDPPGLTHSIVHTYLVCLSGLAVSMLLHRSRWHHSLATQKALNVS